MLEGILFFPSQVSNLGGEGVGEGESEESLRKTSPAACRGGSKKGRTTPLCFEGLKVTHFGISSIYLYNCRKLLQFRGREKRVVNAKKRGLRPEFSGGSPASAHKKSLCCHFMEKASMENHFGFCALKSPQTRMNTDKNGVDI